MSYNSEFASSTCSELLGVQVSKEEARTVPLRIRYKQELPSTVCRVCTQLNLKPKPYSSSLTD